MLLPATARSKRLKPMRIQTRVPLHRLDALLFRKATSTTQRTSSPNLKSVCFLVFTTRSHDDE